MHLLLPVSIFLVVVGVFKFLVLGLVVFAFILTFRLIRGTLGFLGGMMFGFHSHRRGCCAAHRHFAQPPVPPRPVVRPHREAPRAVVQPVQAPRASQEVPRRPYRRGAPTWSLMVLGILFFCLVAFGFRLREVMAFDGPSNPVASPAVRTYAGIHEPWRITAEGQGETKADARRNALEKAAKQFQDEVRGMEPPVEWRPPADYLETQLRDRLLWQEEPAKTFPDPVGRMERVKLSVEVTDRDRQEIRRLDQQVRREGRLLLVAEILAGLLVFLTAVAGYIRLDEWSKGYYTGWLRLAAAGLIGAA